MKAKILLVLFMLLAAIIHTNAQCTYYRDFDLDGYGNPKMPLVGDCNSVPQGYVADSTDCNDSNYAIHPNVVWYQDADGDQMGNQNVTIVSCTAPPGYVLRAGDYFDNDPLQIGPSDFYRCDPFTAQATITSFADCGGLDTVHIEGWAGVLNWTITNPDGSQTGESHGGDDFYTYYNINVAVAPGASIALNYEQSCYNWQNGFEMIGDEYTTPDTLPLPIECVGSPASVLNFSNSNDYIELPDISSSFGAGKITGEAWVRNITNQGKSVGESIMSTPDSAIFLGIAAYEDPDDPYWYLHPLIPELRAEITQSNGARIKIEYQFDADHPLDLNTWHHIAFAADGSYLHLYIDSNEVGSASYDGTLKSGMNNIRVGSWKGYMDEVRLWNRDLCAAEISQHMHNELNGNEPGLLAYYKFNQGLVLSDNSTVTTAIDASVNHNNGTLRNFILGGALSNWAMPPVEDPLVISSSGSPATGLSTFYADADGDGFGNPAVSYKACTAPAGYVTDSTDCNDADAAINSKTVWYRDADGDGFGNPNITTQSCTQPAGYVSDNTDCNDKNANIHPKIFYHDVDGDGYGNPGDSVIACIKPAGYVTNKKDCDDNNATVHPGAPEICGDGIDNNCNGLVDETCILVSIADASVAEKPRLPAVMKFGVTLNRKASQTVMVDYTTQDGTAIAGSDYVAQSGTITFDSGIRRATISVTIDGDKIPEPNETFNILLSNPVNASLNDDEATGTIINYNTAAFASSNEAASVSDKSNSFTIVPNPASSMISISLTGYTGNITFQLINLQGKMIKQEKIQTGNAKYAQKQMKVSDIASGTYFLTLIDEQGNRQTQKAVIEH